MPKKRGQFSYSKKITPTITKSYAAARIRQNKKILSPPKLAGVGVKGLK
jgi:hypothetical protein